MIDMLKCAKNLENFETLAAPGFFFLFKNTWYKKLYLLQGQECRFIQKVETFITLMCTCATMA